MSEGAPPRTKRNGARTFKNPPQPHMCIKDYIMGSSIPCYINVLSWEKVDMPSSPNQPLPLFGGMPLTPPRTEDKNTKVFAVIAHPEVLKQRGKNAQDQNEQSSLVEVLLDFVESMNKGIVFNRIYTILKDRDITGELKEVWIAVQNQRERENVANQQETWIDGQPPAPQYTQPVDQHQQQQQQQQQQQHQQHQQVQEQLKQQFHQQQQLQQQYLHRQQQLQQQLQQQQPPPIQLQPQPLPQQIPQQVQVPPVPQQQLQQNPQMMQSSYMMSQPPQYQHNIVSNLPSNECSNYDKYSYQQQNPVPVSQNEQAYQQNPMLIRSYNNGNGSRVDSDRFNYRERGRSLPQQPMPKQPPPPQQPQQQNCPAYPASQYHFQQLPRQMVPQYINSNMPPSYGGQMNPVPANPYNDFNMMQHQHMLPTGFERRQLELENQMQVEIHRMQQQEQQMLAPPPHMQQPAPQYQSTGMNVVDPPIVKFVRMYKGNSYGRNNMPAQNRNNAPPPKKNVVENTTKPKSPVKVLQRDQLLQNKIQQQNISQSSPEKSLKNLEKNFDGTSEPINVQVTDLDEEDPKPKEVVEVTNEVAPKKPEALNYAAALKEFKDVTTDHTVESKSPPVENPTPSSSESHVQEVKEVKQQHHYNQKRRSIKTVLNRNKGGANDGKVWAKDANKSIKNGMKTSFELVTNLNSVERLQDKDADEQSKGSQPDTQPSTGWNGHVKQKPSDSPKRTQSTVNSIIKIFKIHQGNNGTGEEVTTNRKFKSNGQIKTNTKMTVNEHEETNQGYTILKKSMATVSTSDEVVTEIAQLSIQDCKDTVEKNAVLS